MAKALIVAGLGLVVLGLLWPWLCRGPWGRLPGDILIEKKNVTFYFPWVTSLVLSVVASLILWLISRR
jgi:hypothetical protein